MFGNPFAATDRRRREEMKHSFKLLAYPLSRWMGGPLEEAEELVSSQLEELHRLCHSSTSLLAIV